MPNDILLPRILLTNDDGFDAPGLEILAGVAAEFAQEIWIVAPEEDQSGASQKLSLRQSISATRRGERRWSVKGSPADCVALAIDHLMAGNPPALVLSGVNATTNIGDEINLSGTVGAAMTALMMGVPSIAISQDGPSRKEPLWDTARSVLPLILRQILAEGWKKETALCINMPSLPPEEVKGFGWARQSAKNIGGVKAYRRVSPRGEEYFWLMIHHDKEAPPPPRSEAALLLRGYASLTLLSSDRSLDADRAIHVFPGHQAMEAPADPEPESDALNEIGTDLDIEAETESAETEALAS